MGKTIIISSHILPELSEMCTSIGVMEHGKLVICGKVDEIMAQSQFAQPVRIKLDSDFPEKREQAVSLIRENPFVEKVSLTEEELYVLFKGGDKEAGALLKSLVQNDLPVLGFYREKGDLESVFLKITGGQSA
jgi:ABC-2 type transport system ATP-binding protein